MAEVNCSSCGATIPRDSDPKSWGAWCIPCQKRIKLETPWYEPGMTLTETEQAEAKWKLTHGAFPSVKLEPCPFCGAGQGEHGVHFCVATGRAPYIIECIRCRGRTGGSQSFEQAALQWNLRPLVKV